MQQAAARYLRMLEMAEDPRNEFTFSPDHVIQYCLFLEKLQHVESGNWETTQLNEDGSPNPFIILEPSQIWVEAAIQGFRRRLDGTRLVMVALEVLPRKSAKSLKVAGAALFDICASGQRSPQITIAASTEKQANRVFSPISKFIHNDSELIAEYGLKVTTDTIKSTLNDGEIMKLSSIGERQDGLNPSLAIFEEGHAGAEGVYNVVRSAFGARPNALLRMITTAGYHPSGPGWQLLEQAKLVLSGQQESYSFFAAVYTLDEEDYIDEKSNSIRWDKLMDDGPAGIRLIRKSNPMYGISLMPHMLEEDRKEARRDTTKRGEYARTRYNIWTGAGAAAIDPVAWSLCKRPNLDLADFIGQRCWIGVDLASRRDMCAIGLVFEMSASEIAVFAKFFLPEASALAQDTNYGDAIQAWADDGHLVLTPGAGADHERILAEIKAYCEVYDVQVIACDPYQAHATSQQLWGDNRPVMDYPNNARTMTGPVDDIQTRIATKTLAHDGNPVLAWNVSNVHLEPKGNGSILPRKGNDLMKKIDGFVAIAMADGCRILPEHMQEPGKAKEEQATDPYLNRGIIGSEGMMPNG